MRREAPRALLAAVALVLALGVGCTSQSEPAEPSPSPDAPEGRTTMFTLSSPAFEDGGLIPAEYANTGVSGGENLSIPYEWSGVPDATRSLVLLLVDRHPRANSWVHWLVTSIPADTRSLPRDASGSSRMPGGSREHVNSFGSVGYGGPQPPPGSGKHEYEAVLYALDITTDLPERSTMSELMRTIDGHVLAAAECSGLFGR